MERSAWQQTMTSEQIPKNYSSGMSIQNFRVVNTSNMSVSHLEILEVLETKLMWVHIVCSSMSVPNFRGGGGWSGGAKVLCILHHWGVQLILAYSWARPAILVVGKGRGGMFLFLLFLHFHSCSSFFPVPLFHLLYSLFYLFSPFLWEMTQNDPQGLTCR